MERRIRYNTLLRKRAVSSRNLNPNVSMTQPTNNRNRDNPADSQRVAKVGRVFF